MSVRHIVHLSPESVFMPIQMTFREVNVGLTTVTSLVHEEIRCRRAILQPHNRSEGWVINMSAAITRISCTWRHLTVVEGSGEGRGIWVGVGWGGSDDSSIKTTNVETSHSITAAGTKG